MKEIQLTQGQVALVDDQDFEFLNQWKWHLKKDGDRKYAVRNLPLLNGKQKRLSMHRLIMCMPDDVVIDHINGNGLDNRKCNLRICTNHDNLKNRRVSSNNTSGFKGVSWHKRDKIWQSRIKVNQKYIHLGCFKDPKEGAVAYNNAATKYFGEFALLNEI